MSSPMHATGIPQPWVEVARRCWAETHTFEITYKTAPNGTWIAVPNGQIVIPELIEEEEEEEEEESSAEEEEEEEEEAVREGAEAAAGMAGILFRRAWKHFRTLDRKRAWYKMAALRLEDGRLIEIEHTTIGGALKDDGSIDIETWDEQTDHERERSIQDWALSQAKIAYRMMFEGMAVHMNFANGVTALITETLKARADVAAKHLEFHQANLEAEASKERSQQTGQTLRDFGSQFGQAATIWATTEHAKATRKTDRKPHSDSLIESARTLFDVLDGEMLSYLIPILGSDLTQDVLKVLRTSREDDPDPEALAAAWLALVPSLEKHQAKVVSEVPEEMAKRLTSCLTSFSMLAMQRSS
jgi:hypothetical protein